MAPAFDGRAIVKDNKPQPWWFAPALFGGMAGAVAVAVAVAFALAVWTG